MREDWSIERANEIRKKENERLKKMTKEERLADLKMKNQAAIEYNKKYGKNVNLDASESIEEDDET